jgi:hypothetical protein
MEEAVRFGLWPTRHRGQDTNTAPRAAGRPARMVCSGSAVSIPTHPHEVGSAEVSPRADAADGSNAEGRRERCLHFNRVFATSKQRCQGRSSVLHHGTI